MFTASVIEPSTLKKRALIIISNVHADLAHSYCRTNGFVLRQRLRARVLYASSHRCLSPKKKNQDVRRSVAATALTCRKAVKNKTEQEDAARYIVVILLCYYANTYL